MAIRNPAIVLAMLMLSGCMTLAEKPTALSPCSFEQVWDASIAALSDFQIQRFDKTTGLLETNWMEIAASTQAGALQREIDKERFKYIVEVKPDGRGAVATVLQIREEWSPMGVQSLRWRGIPGSSREESAVAAEIARRLKEKGC